MTGESVNNNPKLERSRERLRNFISGTPYFDKTEKRPYWEKAGRPLTNMDIEYHDSQKHITICPLDSNSSAHLDAVSNAFENDDVLKLTCYFPIDYAPETVGGFRFHMKKEAGERMVESVRLTKNVYDVR